MTCTLTHSDVAGFTGSDNLHYSLLFGRSILYTDGVQFLGQNGCGWLVDKILATLKFNNKVKAEEFVCITLKTDLTLKTAMLTFSDGDDKILSKEKIEFTDCTLEEIKFFFTNNVLMLTSEY